MNANTQPNDENPADGRSDSNGWLADTEPSLNGKGSADGVLYSHKHDAFYNAETGEWLEKKCKDESCGFCVGRPEKAFVSANIGYTP